MKQQILSWTAKRKADVLKEIRLGKKTSEEACAAYDLSPEELRGWQLQFQAFGVQGLRATKIQQYRGTQ